MQDSDLPDLPDDEAALWAALGLEAAPAEAEWPMPLLADDADDLEAVVRRHGGRLPGSDPRRG